MSVIATFTSLTFKVIVAADIGTFGAWGIFLRHTGVRSTCILSAESQIASA